MWSGLAVNRCRTVAAAAAVLLAMTACGGGGGDSTAVPDSAAAAGPGTEMADPMTERAAPTTEPTAETERDGAAGEDGADAEAAAGVYRDYSADLVADPAYDTTILFFHASWCPECRAFDKSIKSGTIPEGVQILKTDYDSETELKQRYGVTIQSTFVKVGPDGEEISSWVGYGKDRSIDTILAELG